MDEKIYIAKHFKKAHFKKNLLENMYQDFISSPEYFLKNKNFPLIRKKIKSQKNQEKIFFSDDEKNVIVGLLAEVGFTISLLVAIKKENVVDFEGLIKTSDKDDLLKEIKLFFIEEFLETSLEPIRKGKVDFSKEEDLPKNLPDIISHNVKEYCYY